MSGSIVKRVVFGGAFLLVTGYTIQLQAKEILAGASAKDEESTGTRGRKTQKIRSGSWVHRERLIVPTPDLRSEFEKRRDKEAAIHFERLATIEVIEELAHSHHKDGLVAQAEGLRRRERTRFRLALARLNRAMRQRLLARGK